MPKPFTKADADRAEVLEANLAVVSTSLVTVAVTPGCQVYWPAPFEVCGRIRDKYNQTGGPNGFLLFPKSNELTNPDRVGKRSEFLGGSIYWTAVTDAHPVAHDFLTKWGQYGFEGGFMKYPTTDEIVLGGLDGRRQEFQGTTLFYSIPTGTHNVQGAIRDKYRAIGAQTNALGFPITDETVTPDGKGRFNNFQNGAIYWSAATGAHPVYPPVLDAWEGEGFEAGGYGYPTADPVLVAAQDKMSQQFQGGNITVSTIGRIEAFLGFGEEEQKCIFETKAEYIHMSTTKVNGLLVPPTVSGHGSWNKIDCPPEVVANVTMQLQYLNSSDEWVNVGDSYTRYNVMAGGKGQGRVPVNRRCSGGATTTWRFSVDVDLVDWQDPPGKAYSPAQDLPCRP